MKRSIVYAIWACLWAAALAGCSSQPRGPIPEPLDVAVQTRPWQAGGIQGRRIDSQTYRIFTTSRSAALTNVLPGFLEAAWRNYHRLTGLHLDKPRQPQTVYLFATYDEWAAMTRHVLDGPQAEKVAGIQAGGFYQPAENGGACIFWNIGGIGALAVASHEGMHQFFDSQLDDQLPMWVEEGLCTVAEGYYTTRNGVVFTHTENRGRWLEMRNIIARNQWTDLQDLLTMDAGQALGPRPGQALGYYAQLWTLMQLIRSDPQLARGLQRLLADAQNGTLTDDLQIDQALLAKLPPRSRAYNRLVGLAAFRHYISDDIESFQARYRAYAAQRVEMGTSARAEILPIPGRFDIATRPAAP
ncbi:MAG: hypothetical protein ACLFUJ_13695 [Phycisphaerae bacterium]